MDGLLLFLAGLGLLLVGAELVVRGATRLAISLGVSPLILGLTVVAVGTSSPELAVGITAALQGNGSLAVGNIAGTNVFNTLFILGLSATLRPLPIHAHVLKVDLPVIVATAAAMTLLAWDGRLTRLEGGMLFAGAILYTAVLLRTSRRIEVSAGDASGGAAEAGVDVTRREVMRARAVYTVVLSAGLGLSVLGADFLVAGAIDIARIIGLSEAVIGLTIVAIGTSAPELATTLVATLKGERDVAIGNLLGSSIYNVLVILALTCMSSPAGLPVERELLLFDIPLMLGVMVFGVPVFWTGRRISRLEGGLGISIYLAYLFSLIVFRA